MKKSEDGGMADTSDLKSAGLKSRVGSTPTPRTFHFYDEIADFTKEQYEFLKDRTPRVLITSLPVGSGRNWIKEMFVGKKLKSNWQRYWETSMCDKVENANRNAKEVANQYFDEQSKPQPYEDEERIYLATSIMLREDLGAVFTRQGIISLKGKGKTFVDVTVEDLGKIIHFANQVTDYEAMSQAKIAKRLEMEREHFTVAVKRTDEKLKELR
jgi:hypothetical protein